MITLILIDFYPHFDFIHRMNSHREEGWLEVMIHNNNTKTELKWIRNFVVFLSDVDNGGILEISPSNTSNLNAIRIPMNSVISFRTEVSLIH